MHQQVEGLTRNVKKAVRNDSHLLATPVEFATVHADLYIAVSTAAISLCTGILEYQKLEVKVASLNRSIKELSKVLHDWDSCAFRLP